MADAALAPVPEDADDDEPQPKAAKRKTGAPGSPRESLAQRRQRMIDEQKPLPLEVEGWRDYGPPVVVAYGTVPYKETRAILDRREKQARSGKITQAQAEMLFNCDVLARACQGVYEVVGIPADNTNFSDAAYQPIGGASEAPKFDEALGEMLGLDTTRATDVVLALYGRYEGLIGRHAAEITKQTGFTDERVDPFTGN